MNDWLQGLHSERKRERLKHHPQYRHRVCRTPNKMSRRKLCWDHWTEPFQHFVLQIVLQSQIMAPTSQSSTVGVRLFVSAWFHIRDSCVWRLLYNIIYTLYTCYPSTVPVRPKACCQVWLSQQWVELHQSCFIERLVQSPAITCSACYRLQWWTTGYSETQRISSSSRST